MIPNEIYFLIVEKSNIADKYKKIKKNLLFVYFK